MKPCPAPNGSLLPPSHRPFLGKLLGILIEQEFRQSKLTPLMNGIVAELGSLCTTDEDLAAWCDELSRWVQWYRVPAYWLTFIFQLLTKTRGSVYHFLACNNYSDAQTNFADDLALFSLETAYSGYVRNQAVLGSAFDAVRLAVEGKLHAYYRYYSSWSRPFAYVDANPCADHLYFTLTESWLSEGVADPGKHFAANDESTLKDVINQCQSEDYAYYGILARRFLGLLYAGGDRHGESAEQYQLALNEARRLKVDTEIGHLRRLLGCALRATGDLPGARHEFEQALAYERLEPFFTYTTYWQAVSARELGDTLARQGGEIAASQRGATDAAVAISDPENLRPALNAYHDGRLTLNGHMTVQCPFPLARAAKQQLFRSYSENAIQVAAVLQEQQDMLAEVEWCGPREATAVVTEIAAARDTGKTPLADFRRNRALYYRTLNTLPGSFEDYLAGIGAYYSASRAYLEQSFTLDNRLIAEQGADRIVGQALKLRLPDTVFLFFHVGQHASMMLLMDMSAGIAAPFRMEFNEQTLLAIHEEYRTAFKAAGTVEQKTAALDKLLTRYQDLLGPTLAPVLRFLPGKHLKIFPRLQMNAVPFHALKLQGKYLIEHCATISYGQTLGLFLENHAGQNDSHELQLRMVMGDKVPWYRLLSSKIGAAYNAGFCLEQQPSWTQLMESLSSRPARDTVFACHGDFDPNDVAASYLRLDSTSPDGMISFSKVFEELDLRACRSVMMGACESGVAQANISAEYIGLAGAMLASGARYVAGALWTIPQVATAVLVDRYLNYLKDETSNVCAALCNAQRDVMRMTRDELSAWIRNVMANNPALEDTLKQVAQNDDPQPYAKPYFWAGMEVVGDL